MQEPRRGDPGADDDCDDDGPEAADGRVPLAVSTSSSTWPSCNEARSPLPGHQRGLSHATDIGKAPDQRLSSQDDKVVSPSNMSAHMCDDRLDLFCSQRLERTTTDDDVRSASRKAASEQRVARAAHSLPVLGRGFRPSAGCHRTSVVAPASAPRLPADSSCSATGRRLQQVRPSGGWDLRTSLKPSRRMFPNRHRRAVPSLRRVAGPAFVPHEIKGQRRGRSMSNTADCGARRRCGDPPLDGSEHSTVPTM